MKRYLLIAAAAAVIGGAGGLTVPVQASQAGAESAALLQQLEKTYTEEERAAALERSVRLDQQVKSLFTGSEMTAEDSYLGYLRLAVKAGRSEKELISFLESGISQLGVTNLSVQKEEAGSAVVRFYTGSIVFEGDTRGIAVSLYRADSGGHTISVYLNRGVVIPSDQAQLQDFMRQRFTNREIREMESGVGELTVKLSGKDAEEKMKAFCRSAVESMDLIDLQYPNPFMAPDGNIHPDPDGTWVMNASGYFIYDHYKRDISVRIDRSRTDDAVTMKITYNPGPISVNMEFMDQLFVTDYLHLNPISTWLADPGEVYLVCDEADREAGRAKIDSVFMQLGAVVGPYMGSGPDSEYLVYGPDQRVISCYEYSYNGQRCFDIKY